ncbi:MAG: hypothetical protein ACRC14_08185 [Paracoccaceae bacterium]
MADLSRILEIRNRKLGKARRAEADAMSAMQRGRHDLGIAQEAVDAFADEIRTLEIDLLRELVESELTKADFGRLESRLKQAEDLARKLAMGLEMAAATLSRRETEAQDARSERREMQSKTARVDELVKLQTDEARVAALREEDAEIEAIAEVISARRGLA